MPPYTGNLERGTLKGWLMQQLRHFVGSLARFLRPPSSQPHPKAAVSLGLLLLSRGRQEDIARHRSFSSVLLARLDHGPTLNW